MIVRPLAFLAALSLGGGCATMTDHLDPTLVEAGAVAGAHAKRAAEAARADIKERAGPPALTQIPGPAPVLTAAGDIRIQTMEPERAGPNSLWRTGARSFFNDQRASRIGDILTVRIDIEDSAEISNSSTRSRTGSTSVGVNSLFGKEESLGRLLPPGGNFDPAAMVEAEGQSSAQGAGSINREERIALTVAAIITDILPNGNLIVQGRQEVRINGELRELTVAGLIRPEDVKADNSIRHDQMAEARIAYGGRGQISAVQRPRVGQRIVDAISPW